MIVKYFQAHREGWIVIIEPIRNLSAACQRYIVMPFLKMIYAWTPDLLLGLDHTASSHSSSPNENEGTEKSEGEQRLAPGWNNYKPSQKIQGSSARFSFLFEAQFPVFCEVWTRGGCVVTGNDFIAILCNVSAAYSSLLCISPTVAIASSPCPSFSFSLPFDSAGPGDLSKPPPKWHAPTWCSSFKTCLTITLSFTLMELFISQKERLKVWADVFGVTIYLERPELHASVLSVTLTVSWHSFD